MYYTPEGRFKLCDSLDRDLFGMPRPQGTWLYIVGTADIEWTNQLQYFHALYTNSTVYRNNLSQFSCPDK